jgi:hypothetical protein
VSFIDVMIVAFGYQATRLPRAANGRATDNCDLNSSIVRTIVGGKTVSSKRKSDGLFGSIRFENWRHKHANPYNFLTWPLHTDAFAVRGVPR